MPHRGNVGLYLQAAERTTVAVVDARVVIHIKSMEAKLRNRTVLIVDDDERNRFALSSYLELLEMRVVTADNGQTALDLLKGGEVVDIILLDIMMPVMDGYEVLNHLRKDEAFSQIPVIAVTAQAMKGDDRRCLEAGASDYVAKPVELNNFVSKIAQWL